MKFLSKHLLLIQGFLMGACLGFVGVPVTSRPGAFILCFLVAVVPTAIRGLENEKV